MQQSTRVIHKLKGDTATVDVQGGKIIINRPEPHLVNEVDECQLWWAKVSFIGEYARVLKVGWHSDGVEEA